MYKKDNPFAELCQLLIVNPRVVSCRRLGRLKAAPQLSVDILTGKNKLSLLGQTYRIMSHISKYVWTVYKSAVHIFTLQADCCVTFPRNKNIRF